MRAESGLDERPASSVLSLFLAPGDSGVFILLGAGGEGAEGERRHLLNTNNGDVVDASLLTGSFQVVVDSSRAVDHLSHLVISHEVGVLVSQHSLEAFAFSEFVNGGADRLLLEHALGGHNDQGFAESSAHLTT